MSFEWRNWKGSKIKFSSIDDFLLAINFGQMQVSVVNWLCFQRVELSRSTLM